MLFERHMGREGRLHLNWKIIFWDHTLVHIHTHRSHILVFSLFRSSKHPENTTFAGFSRVLKSISISILTEEHFPKRFSRVVILRNVVCYVLSPKFRNVLFYLMNRSIRNFGNYQLLSNCVLFLNLSHVDSIDRCIHMENCERRNFSTVFKSQAVFYVIYMAELWK